ADIAAVVAHQRRHEDVRHAEAACLPKIIEAVLADLCCERQVLVAPIRDELVEADRIDHRARQDMRADLRPLLEDDDRELLILLRGELLEPDGCGKASGSGADDDDVEFHGLAFGIAPSRHLAQFLLQISPAPKVSRHSRGGRNPVSINVLAKRRPSIPNYPGAPGQDINRGLAEVSQMSGSQTAEAALLAWYEAMGVDEAIG